jgi:hypothetical protein
MINIFYISTILFIWMNFYYINNKKNLDIRFFQRDLTKMSKVHLLYYCSRIFYWFWVIFGMCTNYFIFAILFSLGILKFPLYHINTKTYIIYNAILPVLNIILMFIILIKYLYDFL